MPVTTVHPLYTKRVHQWKVMRDCIEGEDAIKNAGEEYLPRATGSTNEQYNAYKTRARWINYTKRTLNGLHGLIFRRNPVIECSDDLKRTGVLDNIDRQGTNLYQFLSDSIYDSMITGFGGYLVDFPEADTGLSLYEAEKQGIRPFIRYYPAESIINWKFSVINGVSQLSLVVLKEFVENTPDDEFEHDPVEQYRVLRIENGVYTQTIYHGNVDSDNFTSRNIEVVVRGEKQTSIPFIMVPSREPEQPMFLDLAYCNIGHYQKSADYENGVHLTTIPTGYVTGHKQETDDDGNHEIVNLGHDAFLMFEEPDAKVGTLCFSGAGLTHSETALATAMSDMGILGSRLVTPEKGTSESADSAKIHRAGENASLATFSKNMSEKITQALQILKDWIGVTDVIKVELCTDYDTLAFDPNALNSLANLATAGKLPLPYVFANLVNGEYAPAGATLEEYATLLDMESSGSSPSEIVEEYRRIRQGKGSNDRKSISMA